MAVAAGFTKKGGEQPLKPAVQEPEDMPVVPIDVARQPRIPIFEHASYKVCARPTWHTSCCPISC